VRAIQSLCVETKALALMLKACETVWGLKRIYRWLEELRFEKEWTQSNRKYQIIIDLIIDKQAEIASIK
jgi:uncharacterized protein involved in tolerance to divalent cations